MSYPNRLGEFTVADNTEDWVKSIRYIERRPVHTQGSMNPWETERKRVLWTQEQAAWQKIQPLKAEYASIERQMERDISIYNSHLAELERIVKKKVGMGPIGSYGGMALAVIPGFGWASAAFSMISQLMTMIGGNKQKKRIKELTGILERTQAALQSAKERLIAIQDELRTHLNVTKFVKEQQAAIVKEDIARSQSLKLQQDVRESYAASQREKEIQRIRQMHPNRVVYSSEL